MGCGTPKLPGPFLKRVPRRYSGMVPSTSTIQYSNSPGCEENAAAQSLDWNGDEGGACRAESPCTKVSQHQHRHSGEHLNGQRTTCDTFSIVRLSTRHILMGLAYRGDTSLPRLCLPSKEMQKKEILPACTCVCRVRSHAKTSQSDVHFQPHLGFSPASRKRSKEPSKVGE